MTALQRPSSVPVRKARECSPGLKSDTSSPIFQIPSVKANACRLSDCMSNQYSPFVTEVRAVAMMQQSNAGKDRIIRFVLFIVCLEFRLFSHRFCFGLDNHMQFAVNGL